MAEFSRDDTRCVYFGSDPERVDFVVELPVVSSVHCRLRAAGGGWELEDLGSTNGTFVRGERLAPGEPVPVELGEKVTLGKRTAFVLDLVHVQKLLEPARHRPPRPLEIVREAVPLAKASAATQVLPAASTGRTHAADVAVLSRTQAEAPRSREPEPLVRPPAPGAPSLSIGYADANDEVVPNSVVSGRHARLYLDGDRVLIEDQGSTNGTWVRGERIHLAELAPGQGFALGSHRMELDDALLGLLRQRRDDAARAPAGALAPGRVLTIGREADCDIVIAAAMVSGRHAALTVLAGGRSFTVEDLGSTNGTFLNSRQNRITSPVTAGLDDVIYLGSYRVPIARIEGLVAGAVDEASAVPEGKRVFTVGREAGDVDVVVDRPQVSRRHAEIEILGPGRFALRDLGSANGVFVNGERIRARRTVGVDDTIGLGSFHFRLDEAGRIVHRDYHGDIMLQAQRVSVDVRDPKSPQGRKRIVHDVSFTVYPTEFVGLMGPSGAGKTTLMMALNGYTPPSTGRSLVNDVDLYAHYNAFRGNIGYVPQDDIVFPQLTVYESLYYTARLRLPADTSRAEIDAKIERILARLEIQQTRDVLIGDAVKKGISGGQRKRVNLAQELITEPALLFLDEPTSGLASEDTINVMRLLRALADDGRTILLTIHQPSLEAYRLLDNVIYLVQGNLAYYGPAYPDSITFFHPEAGEGAEREKLLADPANALKPLAHEQRRALEAPTPDERRARIEEAVQRRALEYRGSRYFREFVSERAGAAASTDVQLQPGAKQKADRRGVLRQWAVLTSRAARIKWKDRLNSAILMVQAPIIASVLAAVFAAPGGESAYFDALARGPAALFLLVASAAWFGCSNSAREIVAEQAIYRRERMVNLMIPSYVLSKAAVLGLVCAVQCLVLLGICYVPLQLAGSFGAMYGILLLTSLAGLGMGLTLSALVTSVEAAVALVPLLLIPQIILGGVIMPVHEMNPAMRLLSSAMVVRWGYEGMLHVEYDDDDLGALREECGIRECVWSIGATGYTYYSGDPEEQRDAEESGGAQALAEGPVPFVEPIDEPLCQAFCASVRAGEEITPIDRSFGADTGDAVRAEAVADIVVEGRSPGEYTSPLRHARAGLLACVAVLAGLVAFLHALVMAILKYRDVEVG
jgi:ABC-type multidrug transport system ATPase subunit/pSer/pThr/pTyr-binding forkhead associated (FHA) protein